MFISCLILSSANHNIVGLVCQALEALVVLHDLPAITFSSLNHSNILPILFACFNETYTY